MSEPTPGPDWQARAIAAESALYALRGELHDARMKWKEEADMAGHLRGLLASVEGRVLVDVNAARSAARDEVRESRNIIAELQNEVVRLTTDNHEMQLRLPAPEVVEERRLHGPEPAESPPLEPEPARRKPGLLARIAPGLFGPAARDR